MKNHLAKLKALSNEARLRIVRLLLESKRELCVCELVESLKTPFYGISRHLKELKNASLISEKRRGKFILYEIVPDTFNEKLFGLVREMPASIFAADLEAFANRSVKPDCFVDQPEKIGER